ncbi:MAG: CocE/NonD family hydrolase [Verrucomicrobia bacterium]|nr:CocE/NonD family hydrolase [Verrucomicrobiota bacterium]
MATIAMSKAMWKMWVLLSGCLMLLRLPADGATIRVNPAGPARFASAAAEMGTRTRSAEQPYVLVNGVTSPAYDYPGAIRESVWVRVPDFNGCGGPLLAAADIIRPWELDGTAKVPVIMVASPYYLCLGRGNEFEMKDYDANGNPTTFPLFYDNYFVPRGYAFVAVDMAGTARSSGCSDQGAASDLLSVKAVIDWLNGRATAVDRHGNPAHAKWSNGMVGMIGKSYDGTLANGVAAMGVPGLKTIVPIGAISSWYDYDRYQNLPFSYDYPSYLSDYVAGNRTLPVDCGPCFAKLDAEDGDETGAYTDFWAARDYRAGLTTDASQVKASVFIVHGLQDDNVKTPNFARWWKLLGDSHVQRKLWLTRVGHVDPFDSDRQLWVQTLHRWFDHQLWGIENGIDREPSVWVENAPGHWVEAGDWPVREHEARLAPRADGRLVLGPGSKDHLGWVNNPTQTEATAITAGDNPNRLLFTTGLLTRALRISGAPQFELEVTHSAPTGQVGVELVDYGDAERVLSEGEGVVTTETLTCWGDATAGDDACYFDVARRIGHTPLQVLSRGWARLDHPGTHRLTIDMIPNDIIVPAGHQLGLVVVAASPEWVVTVDPANTAYVLGLQSSLLRIPMVGPVADFRPGASQVPPKAMLLPGALADPHTATRIPH